MSADDAARCMHRRLRAGAARIKSLPSLAADAPASLAQSNPVGCASCTEAITPHACLTAATGIRRRIPAVSYT
eukprot:241496-Pleurochrysis_carterae.AAC.1